MAPWRTQSSSSFIYNHCTLSRRNNLPFSGLLLLTPSSLLPTQFPTTTYHAPKTPSGGRVMVGGYLTLPWAYKRLKRPLICNCGVL